MKIENIVLDLGGVLLHLDIEESIKRFQEIGVYDARQFLNPYKQSGLFLDLERGTLSAYEFVRALSQRYGRSYTYNDIEHCLFGFVREVQAYKFDFIETCLLPHYNLYLLSNNNPFIYNRCNSDTFLPGRRKLEGFFHKTFCSYHMNLCKPEAEIFQAAIDISGMDPRKTLFVDDGEANVHMGKKFGFRTLMPRNGADWRNELLSILHRQ